jgi:hypothetical protein
LSKNKQRRLAEDKIGEKFLTERIGKRQELFFRPARKNNDRPFLMMSQSYSPVAFNGKSGKRLFQSLRLQYMPDAQERQTIPENIFQGDYRILRTFITQDKTHLAQ